MKVIHICVSDTGGAARAAMRINNALQTIDGVESEFVVLYSSDASIKQFNKTSFFKLKKHIFDIINARRLKRYNLQPPFSYEKFGGLNYSDLQGINADIINLHFINGGIFSHSFLKALIRIGKPVVWTLHDMFPFTGGCHYNNKCNGFKSGCGKCFALQSDASNDISAKELSYKTKAFEKLNITFVGCSQWITEEANSSVALRKSKKVCVNIPNTIGTRSDVFCKFDKEWSRRFLKIETDKKIILFGAASAGTDERKGLQFLEKALEYLDPDQYLLAVFGEAKKIDYQVKQEVLNLGNINDDLHLTMLYNAADVFVAPSLQENLANTVMESLASGTPVVAFDIGGMKDMIVTGKNGYIIGVYDVEAMAKAIERLCLENIPRESIAKQAHLRYAAKDIAGRYRDLYQQIVE